jgi:uncharacterized protein
MLIGALIGFAGAVVGAGGGFLLMPVLLTVYGLSPARASGVSLVMVTASALAATAAYVRQRRIDYRAGLGLALFAIPGSVAGARLAGVVPAGLFAAGFGLLLALVGLWLALGSGPAPDLAPGTAGPRSRPLALHAGATLAGGLAALFGIGGGPLMVPLLTIAGRVPVHAATATAQLVILLSSAAGVAGYVAVGGIDWRLAGALSAGALIGAPLGALASPRVPARRLLQLLGACLVVVGARLLLK